jgi:hypothetical protein
MTYAPAIEWQTRHFALQLQAGKREFSALFVQPGWPYAGAFPARASRTQRSAPRREGVLTIQPIYSQALCMDVIHASNFRVNAMRRVVRFGSLSASLELEAFGVRPGAPIGRYSPSCIDLRPPSSLAEFRRGRKKCGSFGSEMQVPSALPRPGSSARRLNSIAAQQRRGEFGWLAQDDNLPCFSELSWFLYLNTA